ncbi:MAG: T9SS type A sorting domain-containing protein [Bacteroidia bacterium]|nr:T9SS type A sorting domain-containing protein [Bacteroidia bacterium]
MSKEIKKIKLFLLIAFLHAQPPKCFTTAFGTNGMDVAYDVKEGSEKSYWIAGQTSGFGFGATDAYLAKMDSMGLVMFHKSFGGFLGDCAKAIIYNPSDSGCFVCGYTQSFGNGGYDMYFFRADKNGNLKWQNYFGGTDWDFAEDLVLGSDGNLYIVGQTFSFGNGSSDGILLKINPHNGQIISWKNIGGSGDDKWNSIIKLSDGNLLVCGTTKSYGETNGDIWVGKLNNNLDTLLTKRFGTAYKDIGHDIMEHPNGQIWIAAFSATSAPHQGDNYALLLDAGFNILGENRIGIFHNQSEGFLKLVHNKSNKDRNLFLTWYFDSQYGFYKTQGYFYLSGSGNVYVIANAFGGSEDDYFYGLDATTDGGFIMVGRTNSFNSINENIIVVKIDTTYINYPSIVSLSELYGKEQDDVWIYGNKIHYNKANQMIKRIMIYDMLGKMTLNFDVGDLKNEQELNLPDGIYILQTITNENQIINKKVIVRN